MSPLSGVLLLTTVCTCFGEVLQLNLDNFMDVIDGPHHKIVKFYAPWCSVCTAIKPHYLKTSDSYPVEETNILFAEVDGSQEQYIVDELGVTRYPTYLYFPEETPDDFEKFSMGSTLAEMHSVINYRFNFSRRIPVPDVPEFITQLNTQEDFDKAVTGRTGHLIVNVYGEACPYDCMRMHMNLPIIAKLFRNDDVTFARLHGEDHVRIVRRFNALFYPSIIFFPKIEDGVSMIDDETGDYTYESYSESKTDPLKLLNWINEKTGYERSESGGLNMEAGNIPVLDEIINGSSSLTDPKLLSELQKAVAELPPHDDNSRYPNMANAYLRIATNVMQNGELYVTSEMVRLEEEIAKEELEPEDLDDLRLTLNVFKVFGQQVTPAYHSTFSGEGAEVGEL